LTGCPGGIRTTQDFIAWAKRVDFPMFGEEYHMIVARSNCSYFCYQFQFDRCFVAFGVSSGIPVSRDETIMTIWILSIIKNQYLIHNPISDGSGNETRIKKNTLGRCSYPKCSPTIHSTILHESCRVGATRWYPHHLPWKLDSFGLCAVCFLIICWSQLQFELDKISVGWVCMEWDLCWIWEESKESHSTPVPWICVLPNTTSCFRSNLHPRHVPGPLRRCFQMSRRFRQSPKLDYAAHRRQRKQSVNIQQDHNY